VRCSKCSFGGCICGVGIGGSPCVGGPFAVGSARGILSAVDFGRFLPPVAPWGINCLGNPAAVCSGLPFNPWAGGYGFGFNACAPVCSPGCGPWGGGRFF
jgi:hypothetical protein